MVHDGGARIDQVLSLTTRDIYVETKKRKKKKKDATHVLHIKSSILDINIAARNIGVRSGL